MAEEYWRSSPLSIARLYGGIKMNGVDYIIVNKEGKDLFECSEEAEKAGHGMAIEPGEPADLIRKEFQSLYRKLGRDKFIELLDVHKDIDSPKDMKKYIKEEKL